MTNENGKVKRSRRDTARRVRNIHYIPLCSGGHGMPCPYKLMLPSVLCNLSVASCQCAHLLVPLSQGAKRVFRGMTECHSVPSEGRKGPLEKVLNILSCPLRGALSSATRGKLPSATLGRAKRRGYASLLPILRSLLTVVFLQTPPSLRATSPNLVEESGRMTNGNVKTER